MHRDVHRDGKTVQESKGDVITAFRITVAGEGAAKKVHTEGIQGCDRGFNLGGGYTVVCIFYFFNTYLHCQCTSIFILIFHNLKH